MPKDEYLNYMRDSLAESAAGTLTESTIKTGLTYPQGGLAQEIWNIVNQLALPQDTPGAGATESAWGVLSAKTGLSSVPSLVDNHVLYKREVQVKMGNSDVIRNSGHNADYNPIRPILYASPDLYHYVKTSNAAAAGSSIMKIGFYYVDIGKERYYEILESFQTIWG